MSAPDRSYSFRAPSDFAQRLRDASRNLREVTEADADAEIVERIAHELALAIVRERVRLGDAEANQSAFMRDAIELVVSAAEKVTSDRHWAAEYAAAGRSPEEEEFTSGARTAAGRRWRSA